MLSRLQQIPARRMVAGVALGGVAAAYCGSSMWPFADASGAEPALSKKEFKSFRLSKVERLNHNVSRYRVELPTPESEIGMVTSGMLMVQGFDESGNPTKARPYTPTSLNSTKGYFDLVIKHYPGGVVSGYVEGLKEGDQISVKGPYTKKKILPNQYKELGLIAGGSGLTPMLQVAQELCNSVEDETKMTLLFCNQTPSDVYLKDELDELAAMYPEKLTVVYCVDKTDGKPWDGLTGYLSGAHIKEYMPSPSDSSSGVFVCGPPPMMAAIAGPKTKDFKQGDVAGLLGAAGFSSSQVHKF